MTTLKLSTDEVRILKKWVPTFKFYLGAENSPTPNNTDESTLIELVKRIRKLS